VVAIIGSRSCPFDNVGFSGVEPSGSITCEGLFLSNKWTEQYQNRSTNAIDSDMDEL